MAICGCSTKAALESQLVLGEPNQRAARSQEREGILDHILSKSKPGPWYFCEITATVLGGVWPDVGPAPGISRPADRTPSEESPRGTCCGPIRRGLAASDAGDNWWLR
jgi:hypothetical protein